MTIKRLSYYFAALIASLILLVVELILFIPSEEIFNLIVRAASNEGITLSSQQISRALPFGIKCKNLSISDSSPLLNLDSAEIRVNLLPLLAGRLSVTFVAAAAGGNINGLAVWGRKKEFEISADSLNISKIPYFKSAFAGDLDSEINIKGAFSGVLPVVKGKLVITSKAVQTRSLSINGVGLPDSVYRSVKGAFILDGNRLKAESIALDGEGIYARLSGAINLSETLTSSPLDFKLEFMPKPEFIEKQKLIFLLLAKYTISPGNYSIPIKGTIRSPSIL